ncbi:MAG: O-antigen ligase family protein [Pseudomonadota bacterium]
MAKKKRINSRPDSVVITAEPQNAPKSTGAPANAGSKPRPSAKNMLSGVLPAEIERGDWTVAILAFMMFLTPAIGVPNEEMLQDTLKSIVASLAAISAGLLFFWQQRNRRDGLRWHAVMWLPLALMFYALGSMIWSHAYLGGVEAIRWFIFSLLLFLGINTLSRERIPYLAEGIHWGAVAASLWAVLQFLFDFTYFPQGPNPASTFVNRNFFAEFVVCTLPFSTYLLFQSKGTVRIALMSFTLGFNIVALMMTGTRGALSAMWLMFGIVLPVIAVVFRKQFAFHRWDAGRRILACGVLLSSVVGLGLLNTNNAKLLIDAQYVGTNAFDRAFKRTASISAGDYSLGIRMIMWKATGRIIEARPVTGVGAGAWEAMLPLYQTEGSQLETDYYVHNEVLQLLAEYGLTGWVFLLALASYLLYAAWRTLRDRSAEAIAEGPMRAVALASLLAFLIVSNIGFPWRLASTGCLFALGLALLAASDARLKIKGPVAAMRMSWRPAYSQIMAVFLMASMALAIYISVQAAAVEQKIVRAVKMSLGITQSGDPNNPKWDKTKRDILALTKEAITINTHYRKITPMVADEFAKWGDWKNAVWVWESVAVSRPYVVAIMSNIARGYAQIGNNEKALEFLARCEKLQPKAPSVRSLKVILMSRTGKEAESAILARQYIEEGTVDFDLINAGFVLSMRKGDYDFALKTLEIRNKSWPGMKADSFIKMAGIYTAKKDDTKALAAYKSALDETPAAGKAAVRQQIPPAYLARL